MERHEVTHATFAAREFTSEPVPDDMLPHILENVRFAPSGGNRQGWHVIVVKHPDKRTVLAPLIEPREHAVAAMLPIGKPVKQLTRLRRKSVAAFATVDSFNGGPFGAAS